MRPADLIFVRGHLTSLVDDAIKLAEHIETGMKFVKCYTHCAIYIGDDTVAEAQGGRKSGPAPLSLYEGNYDIGYVNLTDEQRQKVVEEAKRQFGRSYDWILDVEIGVEALTGAHLPRVDYGARQCVTYVKDVFAKALYMNLCDGDTPQHLALSKYVTIQHKSSGEEVV